MSDDFWSKNFGIIPVPVSDTVIWRAANQMIKRYADKAAMEVAMRSNAALEISDTFNHELRQRVVMAVTELKQPKPTNPNTIN